jgi:hypothetical protein
MGIAHAKATVSKREAKHNSVSKADLGAGEAN